VCTIMMTRLVGAGITCARDAPWSKGQSYTTVINRAATASTSISSSCSVDTNISVSTTCRGRIMTHEHRCSTEVKHCRQITARHSTLCSEEQAIATRCSTQPRLQQVCMSGDAGKCKRNSWHVHAYGSDIELCMHACALALSKHAQVYNNSPAVLASSRCRFRHCQE
jgi:hypothetical protein